MDLLWIGTVSSCAALAAYLVFYFKLKGRHLRKLPSLAEYLERHPECRTDDNEKALCYSCKSDKVVFQPLTRVNDPRYKHRCMSCKKILFGSENIFSSSDAKY